MDQHKTVKEYAHAALECFDKMAMPEIKNRVMASIWNFLKKYIKKTIDKKDDKEIHEKLLEIYITLNPLFENLQVSAEIHKAEAMGSMPLPKEFNELQQKKNLLKMDKERAAKLIEEFLKS